MGFILIIKALVLLNKRENVIAQAHGLCFLLPTLLDNLQIWIGVPDKLHSLTEAQHTPLPESRSGLGGLLEHTDGLSKSAKAPITLRPIGKYAGLNRHHLKRLEQQVRFFY